MLIKSSHSPLSLSARKHEGYEEEDRKGTQIDARFLDHSQRLSLHVLSLTSIPSHQQMDYVIVGEARAGEGREGGQEGGRESEAGEGGREGGREKGEGGRAREAGEGGRGGREGGRERERERERERWTKRGWNDVAATSFHS